MITRRAALKNAVLSSALLSACSLPRLLQAQAAPAASGPFKLPALPYAFDALEPHLDARTMEIHHDRHHAAYVANLNKAVAAHEAVAKRPIDQLLRHLDEVPDGIRTAIRNHGGGHYNHTLFWQMMKKGGGGEPTGPLAKALDKQFGSFSKFREDFSAAAMKVFGSGWAWLSLDEQSLKISTSPNQDSPLLHGQTPLLGLDVWEHAYYLKYQNKRVDYVAAFFNVINWDYVTHRFESQMK